MNLGRFVPAKFVVPHNPLITANIPETGNPVVAHLAGGCLPGRPCLGRINGMGSFDVFGINAPGSSWMYLLGAGLIGGMYLFSRMK